MTKHLKTGKKGEDLAVQFLREKGYEILATNWRFRRSEIDIIAKDGKVLVFIEVKTRSSDYFGTPASFVSQRKKTLLQDAATAYMQEVNHTWEIRFDIIGILIRSPKDITINHFEDAFFPGI
ncbi:MAG: YraN family protein [Bacteroidota bacterium]